MIFIHNTNLGYRQQKAEVKAKGYPPAVRDIGKAVGLASSSTVQRHLERLEKKGLIRRDPTKSRALELLCQDESNLIELYTREVAKVPIVGKVTAGIPITATENLDGYFPLPEYFVHDQNVFILSVLGDSMIEVGIYSGDYMIVRQQQTADNGDIVVAMTVDDETTVKTFYKENGHIRLQPENSSMEPIILKNVTILGKVIGVFRSFQ